MDAETACIYCTQIIQLSVTKTFFQVYVTRVCICVCVCVVCLGAPMCVYTMNVRVKYVYCVYVCVICGGTSVPCMYVYIHTKRMFMCVCVCVYSVCSIVIIRCVFDGGFTICLCFPCVRARPYLI